MSEGPLIPPSKNVYTVEEVAALLNVAPRIVSRWVDSGRLRGFYDHDTVKKIPRDYLIFFMKERGMSLGPLNPPKEEG